MTMVITVECPSCATSFPVDPRKIPEKGVKVRCSSCAAIFRVERPAEPTAPPPPAPEPVAEPAPAHPAPPAAPEPVMDEAPHFDAAHAEGSTAADEARTDEVAGEVAATAEDAAEEAERTKLASGPVDDWVMETEDNLDASGLDIEPLDTIESSGEGIGGDVAFTDTPSGFEPGAPPIPEPTPYEVPAPTRQVETPLEPSIPEPIPMEVEDTFTSPTPEAPAEPASIPETRPFEPTVPENASVPEAPPGSTTGAAGVGAFTFGKRDPRDKARRLARVLVSDMIMYNPERHQRALANGTLKEDFEEEIKKSWKEYVEQVGDEMARSNDFWTDALNDVLARGEQVF